MPINLGTAAFGLVINGTNFASGMAKMGGSVAGFADHVTKGMAKSTQAYRAFSTESVKVEDRIKSQTDKIGRLKQELDSHKTSVQQSAQANATITSRISASTKAIEKQSEEIRRLTAFSKAWRDARKADLIAAGMQDRAATTQANADYKAHLFQENQRLESMKKRLSGYEQQNQAALLSHTILANEEKQRIAAIQLEESALAQLQQQRANMGQGPAAPGRVATSAERINEFSAQQIQRARAFGEAVGGINTRFERFTRGIRGASEEFGKQQERVYAARQAMTSYEARINQARAAVDEFSSRFEQAAQQEIKRRAQIAEAMALEERKVASILAEKDKLNAMAGKATQAAIAEQMAKIAHEEQSLARARENTQKQRIFQKQDAAQLDELKSKYETSRQFLKKLEDQRRSHTDKIKEEENKLKSLVKEEKEGEKATKAMARAKKESTQAVDENGRKLSWFSSILVKLGFTTKNYVTNVHQATAGTNQLSQSTAVLGPRLERMRMFFATLAGSAVGSFFGNLAFQMSNASAQALDVFKSNEMMQLSLQSMIAGQLVATGVTKDLSQAQAMSVEQAKNLDAWMKRLAIASPFSQTDVKDSIQLGLSLGFNIDQIKRLTDATVDWAAASGKTGAEMTQVIRAMGQMNSTGKATLEDLNQLTNVGIGWSDVLEKEFQVEIEQSGKSLRDLISAGIIPADRAIGAITESFETNFAGGAEKAGTSVTGLLASLGDIKDEALRAGFTGLFEALKPLLQQLTDFFINGDAIERIREFGTAIGEKVGGAIQWLQSLLPGIISVWNDFAPAVMEGMSVFADLASEAYNWGAGLIAQYAEGIWSYVSVIIDIVQEIGRQIAYWMMPQSPPRFLPDIDKWGGETMKLWRDGMTQTDMSSISEVGAQVRELLSDSMGDDRAGLSGMVIGSEEAMAKAIGEFKKTGVVSESTFAQLRNAAGSAGQTIEAYARSMFDAQAATKRVSDAQANLNAVTKKYDDMLAPLNAKLDAARKKSEQIRLGKEIKSLEDMLNFKNPAGLEFDMSEVRAKIEELRAEEAIIGVEAEREKAITQAEKQVELAEKDAVQKQDAFQLIKAQIGFEQERNNELRNQIEIMEEQVEKLGGLTAATGLVKDETAALAKAEFDTAMMQATAAEKVQLLTDRLATLTPGTVEYEKTKQDLIRAEADYTKELERQEKQLAKVGDAEFEANLAGMTREEQLVAMNARLSELTEGTVEYEKMRKRINALDLAQEKSDLKKLGGGSGAGGGGGGLPKGMLSDKPFEGVKETVEAVKGPIEEVGKTVTSVKGLFDGWAKSIRSFFSYIGEYGKMIGTIAERLAAAIVFFTVVERIIAPIARWVLALGRFLTPLNLFAAALIGLGIAFREDIGGIQGILQNAFKDISPILESITQKIGNIVSIFQSGNLQAGFEQIAKDLPKIFGNVGEIIARLVAAMGEWVGPFVEQAAPVIAKMFDETLAEVARWAESGGLEGFLKNMFNALAKGFDGWGKALIESGLAVLTGGVSLLINYVGDQVIKNTPMLLEKFEEWKQGVVTWMLDEFPKVASTFGVIAGGLLSGALKGIMAATPKILAWVLDLANMFLALVPGIIAGLSSFLLTFGTWLLTDGIAQLFRTLGQIQTVVFTWIIENGPRFFFEIGRILGDVLVKLGAAIVSIILYWITQIGPLIQEYNNWFNNEWVPLMMEGIKNAFLSVSGFLAGVLIGFLQPIMDAFQLFMSDAVQNTLAGFGVAIDEGGKVLLKRWLHFWDDLVMTIKNLLGIESPSTVFFEIGMMVIQGAIDGVASMAESLTIAFIVLVQDIKRIFNNFMIDAKLLWKRFKEDIDTVVRTLRDAVTDNITNMALRATSMFYSFRDNASTAIDTWKSNVTTAVNGAKEALDGIVDKVRTALDDIKKFFTDEKFRTSVMDAAKNIGKSMIDGIIAGVRGGFEFLKTSLVTFLQENLRGVVEDWISDFLGKQKPPASSAAPSGGGGGGNTSSSMTPSTSSVQPGRLGFMSAALNPAAPWSNQGGATAPAGANQYQIDQLVQEYLSTGRISRRNLAQFAVAARLVDRFGNFRGGMFADLSGVFRYIQNLATERTLAMAGPSIGGTVNSVSNNASSVTNNYNATFQTTRSSNGLMNDFNVMRTLRRV